MNRRFGQQSNYLSLIKKAGAHNFPQMDLNLKDV